MRSRGLALLLRALGDAEPKNSAPVTTRELVSWFRTNARVAEAAKAARDSQVAKAARDSQVAKAARGSQVAKAGEQAAQAAQALFEAEIAKIPAPWGRTSDRFRCPKCGLRECTVAPHEYDPDEGPVYHCRCACGAVFVGH